MDIVLLVSLTSLAPGDDECDGGHVNLVWRQTFYVYRKLRQKEVERKERGERTDEMLHSPLLVVLLMPQDIMHKVGLVRAALDPGPGSVGAKRHGRPLMLQHVLWNAGDGEPGGPGGEAEELADKGKRLERRKDRLQPGVEPARRQTAKRLAEREVADQVRRQKVDPLDHVDDPVRLLRRPRQALDVPVRVLLYKGLLHGQSLFRKGMGLHAAKSPVIGIIGGGLHRRHESIRGCTL